MYKTRLYLRYKASTETLVRQDRGGEKVKMEKGDVLDFGADMAVFYLDNYGSDFEEVAEKESVKKKPEEIEKFDLEIGEVKIAKN